MTIQGYDTAKTQTEQRMLLLRAMYDSAKKAVEFQLSLGRTADEAIEAAKAQSTAGYAVWARIRDEYRTETVNAEFCS